MGAKISIYVVMCMWWECRCARKILAWCICVGGVGGWLGTIGDHRGIFLS